jgi:hypothetical protein
MILQKNQNKRVQHILLMLLTLTLSHFAYAQSQRLWGTYYGRTGLDVAYDVATDQTGSV